jgi:hypothetical protein
MRVAGRAGAPQSGSWQVLAGMRHELVALPGACTGANMTRRTLRFCGTWMQQGEAHLLSVRSTSRHGSTMTTARFALP